MLTLSQFEQIDQLMADLLHAGPFEETEFPRAYIKTENALFDACVDALGYEYTNDFPSALECAAHVVAGALLGTITVTDEVAL